MIRILANDGIAADGKTLLEQAGFEVITDTIPQAELPARVGEFDVLIVRSATKVNAAVLENPGKLKLVVRAGVGIDNIDTKAAEAKGVAVSNTPNSSTLSVAELVFAHLFSLARFLNEANRMMPEHGRSQFKELKKKYEKGFELRGKTLGIIGFGRIGQETAKIAISLGMKVIAFNRTPGEYELVFDHLPFNPAPSLKIQTKSMEDVLREADFISLHVPHKGGTPALLGEKEFSIMKKGAVIINCARGGVVNEADLIVALKNGTIAFAGIDVFENEPDINEDLIKIENLSLSPHIGASTKEAQARVSKEVAELVISRMG
jgi:D-3-phosphoglycerate dehydrogenase